MNLLRSSAIAAMLLSAGVASASTSITQKPTGASVNLDLATDGTNFWPAHLIWDGTTWATVNAADSGLTVHVANWLSTIGVTGTFWQATQPVSAASLPLPSGAATAANQTSVLVAQGGATAATNAAQVAGVYDSTPPTLTNGQGAALLLNATGRLQVDGSSVTQPVSGTVTVVQPTGSNNHVVCDSGCSSSTAPNDNTAFTTGTTPASPIAGLYQSSATSNPLTAGREGIPQLTQYRALMFDWFNSSGTEMGTAGSPVQVSLTNTGANGTALSVNLGTIGTAATAANQTTANTSLSTIATNTTSIATAALQTTGNTALGTLNTTLGSPMQNSGGSVNLTQGGTALSAANPVPATLSVGGAAVTTSNPEPVGLPPDSSPSTQSITAADSATSSATWSNGQSVLTGTPTANSAASFGVNGVQSVAIQVSGSGLGTLEVDGSFDGGTTWVKSGLVQKGVSGNYSTFGGSGLTPNFVGEMNLGTFTNVRVRATQWTSGTATVKVNQSAATVATVHMSGAPFAGPSGGTPPTDSVLIGGVGPAGTLQSAYFDPCTSNATTPLSINITTSAGTAQITGTSGKNVYICSGSILAGSASTLAVFEGTGTVCGTGTTYRIGNSATTGFQFGANGGIEWQPTGYSHLHTTTSGDNVCFEATNSGVFGIVQYVIQ